jgi:hypothetical protein
MRGSGTLIDAARSAGLRQFVLNKHAACICDDRAGPWDRPPRTLNTTTRTR